MSEQQIANFHEGPVSMASIQEKLDQFTHEGLLIRSELHDYGTKIAFAVVVDNEPKNIIRLSNVTVGHYGSIDELKAQIGKELAEAYRRTT